MHVSRLDMLKQIAAGLAAQFGKNCEIVIHDLTTGSLEHSIVHIENGGLTGRRVGDGPSRIVFDAIRHEEGILKDKLAYLTRTENGRALKSSTIYIKGDDGKPNYIFSINFDITTLLAVQDGIHSIVGSDEPEAAASPNIIIHDVNGLLDELIEQSVALVGVPVSKMTKEDKIRAINFLNDAGAFLITKSGDKVAKYFEISKYTLYSYVDINK